MKSIIVLLVSLAVIECLIVGNPCSKSKDPNCGITVEVGVYIESLCPDSRAFVIDQLYPTFTALYEANPPILTLNIVPFGNAQMTFNPHSKKNPSLNFTCQHKDQECEGNIIQSCGVFKLEIEKSLALVTCMFNSTNWKSPWDSAAECTKKLNLDYNELNGCANSEDGIAIEYFMAGQTLALDPRHNWIPWITLNGEHTDEIQEKATTNLLKLVCDTYGGVPKPKPCDSA